MYVANSRVRNRLRSQHAIGVFLCREWTHQSSVNDGDIFENRAAISLGWSAGQDAYGPQLASQLGTERSENGGVGSAARNWQRL